MAGKEASSKGASDRAISAFAEGTWVDKVHVECDKLVACHSALEPSRASRRSKPHHGSTDPAVTMVKDFFESTPSWDHCGGIAAWHEPSEAVASWMSKNCHKVNAELTRRAAMMNGKISFRLSFFRQRCDPLAWHAIVAEGYSMQELRDAVSLTGKSCFTRSRGASQAFFNKGKHRLRQCAGGALQQCLNAIRYSETYKKYISRTALKSSL
jgi:hypothetical protein